MPSTNVSSPRSATQDPFGGIRFHRDSGHQRPRNSGAERVKKEREDRPQTSLPSNYAGLVVLETRKASTASPRVQEQATCDEV